MPPEGRSGNQERMAFLYDARAKFDSVFRTEDFEVYLGHMKKLDRLELGDDPGAA